MYTYIYLVFFATSLFLKGSSRNLLIRDRKIYLSKEKDAATVKIRQILLIPFAIV